MAAPEEKRQAQRIQPFVAPCRYRIGDTRVPAFLTDLSPRGGRIQADVEAPEVGTLLEVEVRIGRLATHLRLPGTVRWSRAAPRGGYVFGMSFDGVSPRDQAALDGVVDEFRRRAASIG
jgi:hypothetical protein